jgi:uncharacterized protein DUF3861
MQAVRTLLSMPEIMKQHTYRITIEHLADQDGSPVATPAFTFLARNHDDIPAIVQRARPSLPFDADESSALLVGLKLFAEVMLVHRKDPLFEEFYPHVGKFMQQLKELSSR